MLRCSAILLASLLPSAAFAQGSLSVHARYDTYAAGFQAAEVDAGFSLGPSIYHMSLGYHTVGVVGLFFGGHQLDVADGSWRGSLAIPSQFVGQGFWRDQERIAEIDYQQGRPVVRKLLPPNTVEREPVPEPLQVNSIDTLSAIAQLIRAVGDTGRCETKVHTFDGRRATEIEAHTVGEAVLAPTGRSSFAGRALRCDFSGRMLAGFKFDDNRGQDARPMHGSAWLAPVVAGGPPLPVRMVFETRWFGDAAVYLTAIGPAPDLKVVRGN